MANDHSPPDERRADSGSEDLFWRVGPGDETPAPLREQADARARAVFDFWRTITPPGALPGRQHLDPCDIAPRLLPNIVLIDVVRTGPDLRFRYRLVGTALVTGIGREVTGRFVDEFEAPGRNTTTQRLTRVADSMVSWRRGVPRLNHTAGFRTLENISLPMARDGATVDMILGLTLFH